MAIAAEAALRAWTNSLATLVGEGNPVALGAYLRQQRSPDSGTGAYCVIARTPGGAGDVVAEQDTNLDMATITAQFHAGTEEASEAAAAAWASEVQNLSGCPAVIPGTSIVILVADNILGPSYLPMPATSGEPYVFQVVANFLLTQPE